MNIESHSAHVEVLHDHVEAAHGTFRGYMTGFILSVILTAIPFWLVMGHVFADSRVVAIVIMGFAVVQIVVHMIYFLHMNTRSEGGWTLLAMTFTLVVVVITISGSVWVMNHLNDNMMPMAPQEAQPGSMHMSPESMRQAP